VELKGKNVRGLSVRLQEKFIWTAIAVKWANKRYGLSRYPKSSKPIYGKEFFYKTVVQIL